LPACRGWASRYICHRAKFSRSSRGGDALGYSVRIASAPDFFPRSMP
jgi:hypothetical protein